MITTVMLLRHKPLKLNQTQSYRNLSMQTRSKTQIWAHPLFHRLFALALPKSNNFFTYTIHSMSNSQFSLLSRSSIPRLVTKQNKRPNRTLRITCLKAQRSITATKHPPNRTGLRLALDNPARTAGNRIRVPDPKHLSRDRRAKGRERVVGDVGGDGRVVGEACELESAVAGEFVGWGRVADGGQVPG